MSLTIKKPGRGRRVAAGSLIAVAALGLSACKGGTDAASRPSSAAASAPSSDAGQGSGAQASGSGHSPGAKPQSSAPGGHRSSAAPVTPKGTVPRTTQSQSSAMAASDRCTAAAMSLRLGHADIGAGNIRYPLIFTNKSKKACTLRGFPGVSLINRDGSAVGKPATRAAGAGGVVRLQPGQSAHALLHTVNEGVSDIPCWAKSQIVYVYPPGSKEPMTTGSDGLRVCGGRFDVTAVEPGSLG
ncbi:DUF4232 domain-containing protein [Streptomyces kronopolitis]|uniref:DUF4232 domain-containing protein n=1 Tax=Streptomyces kronopolitis TaxID=1612435 RepID=UPI003D971352